MPARRLLAVLLDMGGVLLPERQSYERAARDASLLAALREQGIAEPGAFVAERAVRLRDAYRALEQECGQPDLELLFRDCTPAVRALVIGAFKRESSPPPYAHAREVVARLAQRYRLGLISNNAIPGGQEAAVLRRTEILRHFGAAFWSAEFGRRKPDPGMLFAALETLRVPPARAVFVGDKLRTDVAAARAAGVRSVYLRKRGAPLASGSLRPDFTIGDLRALPILLRSLG